VTGTNDARTPIAAIEPDIAVNLKKDQMEKENEKKRFRYNMFYSPACLQWKQRSIAHSDVTSAGTIVASRAPGVRT